MTGVRRARRPKVPKLEPQTILGVFDVEARVTANEVRTAATAAVRAEAPGTGRLKRGMTGRVSRTQDGFRIEVAPTSRVRYPSGVTAKQVARFVTGGTGVFGPSGRPIRPRHGDVFRLPGGWTGEVQGQRPNPFIVRGASRVDATTLRIMEDGAERAARHAERVI